jgi:cyclophilin family peptidyl-prolyl cis-trans isomerase
MKIKILVALVLCLISTFSFAANPQVTLQVTGGVSGTIVIELYADKAPVTTANFINYVKTNFYNGTVFHRVIKDFMIQGGGFDTNFTQKTTNPAIINESSNRLSNLRGTIAMARLDEADTATSEFFINQNDNDFLDYGFVYPDYYCRKLYTFVGYCVFGKVISGMTVVDSIANVATETKNGMDDVPVNKIVLQSATITLNAPVCAQKLIGDVDNDCNIDLADFAAIAQNWLKCNSLTICR